MNTHKKPKIPAIILDRIADTDHYTHILCVEFVNLFTKFSDLHSVGNVHPRLTRLLTSELRGFVFAVRCLIGNHSLHHAFCVVLDELFCLDDMIVALSDKENSAVVATVSPDSAVLENAVVETAQGTTYSLPPFPRVPNVPFFDFKTDYSSDIFLDYAYKVNHFDAYERFLESKGTSVQLTDSFFDLLPLSAYSDLDSLPLSCSHSDRVGG